MCSFREWGRYCVRIMTSEIPELTQLESVKSMIRYFPAKGTAGLARFSVRTPRREPSPPARMTARALTAGLLPGPRRLRALVQRGVLPGGRRPGEVARHAVALELGPFGALSVHLERPFEGVPERPRVEFVEHQAGPPLVPGVRDGVGEPPGPAGHGDAAVAHRDHLSQPAGLVAGRDEQGVGAGVDAPGVPAVEPQPNARAAGKPHLELRVLVLEGGVSRTEQDELPAALEPALDRGHRDVEALLLDQTGDHAQQRHPWVRLEAGLLLEGRLVPGALRKRFGVEVRRDLAILGGVD